MKLSDHADRDENDYVLAAEAHGCYRLELTETTPADEVSPPGAFPEYGQFVPVTRLTRTGKENGTAWLEAPHGLAKALKEAGLIEVGAVFTVEDAAKSEDGAWTFRVEPGAPADDEA